MIFFMIFYLGSTNFTVKASVMPLMSFVLYLFGASKEGVTTSITFGAHILSYVNHNYFIMIYDHNRLRPDHNILHREYDEQWRQMTDEED